MMKAAESSKTLVLYHIFTQCQTQKTDLTEYQILLSHSQLLV